MHYKVFELGQALRMVSKKHEGEIEDGQTQLHDVQKQQEIC